MKIRINDLARELEVKSKAILDVLEEVGVTEKKTHSSSVEEDEAERVRKHFAAKSGTGVSRERSAPAEMRPKIDLSKISKPGDVLKLIKEKEQQHSHPAAPPRPPAPPAAVVPKPPVGTAAPTPGQLEAARAWVGSPPTCAPTFHTRSSG